MPCQLQIRTLREEDIDFADRLRELAGWNQTRNDWLRFLRYDPGGCFAAEWDGEAVGTVTTTRYPGGLAWIGMMLVDPAFRRRGIASALMERALDYLQEQGSQCIKLDATPAGEPVYEKLGFRGEWTLHRWTGEGSRLAVEAAASDSPGFELPDYDAPIFGDDRARWVNSLAGDASKVVMMEGAYGMLREGMRADYLGPVVARSEAEGLQVARALLGMLRRTTYWDLPDLNQAAVELAREHGFEKARSLRRMWLGTVSKAGEPRLQFGLGDPATG